MKNILSLFDGMSCLQIALNQSNIKYENYFASEIDKYAIKVTQCNYLNTNQIGDITKIKGSDLPQIDLLCGGSPCQGFSFAGKGLNFDDHRSKLFFEYVRLLKETKPKYFILENVIMKKEYQDVISKYLGVEPIMINSALVSAQNRKRLYWTNIEGIEQPQDKHIYLKDIIEESIDINENLLKNKAIILSNVNPSCRGQNGNVYSIEGKAPTVTTNKGEGNKIMLKNNWRKLTPLECERLQTVPDNYTNHVSNSQRYKMLGNGFTVEVIKHILNYIKHI